jgi:dihydrofolate synthase/folylpolyglutamate synthase
MSFFEVNTLLALATFRRLGSRLDLLEVGLGGRWDSTNVASPRVAVITSIGLDHQSLLGASPAAIAAEKAGIMRPGIPVLWAGATGGALTADAVIREAAAKSRARLTVLGEDLRLAAKGVEVSGDGDAPAAVIPVPDMWRRLPPYLRRNAVLATAAARALDPVTALDAACRRIDTGTAPTPPTLIARFQRLTVADPQGGGSVPLLLDVCHNIDGAHAFAAAVRETYKAPLPALISVLRDKDVNGILDGLATALSPLVLFAGAGERAWSRGQLEARHRHWPWAASLEAAWKRRPQGSEAKPLAVCGSVAVVGELLGYLGRGVLGEENGET